MKKKRMWIALLAIPVFLVSILVIGAQRSHEASAGGGIDPTCVSSVACIEYDNNGSGPAIKGIGLDGQGIVGVTRHNSTSASSGRAGVIGSDFSTSGTFNDGVNGFSSRGVGVAGGSNTGIGVRGVSTNNVGVIGTSTNGNAVVGRTGNPSKIPAGLGAVFGDSFYSDGVIGTSANGVGVEGISTNGFGLYALSSNGPGVEAHSGNYYGANVSGGLNDSRTGFFDPALTVVGDGSRDLIDGCPSGTFFCHTGTGLAPAVFQLDQSGNITIAGKIFTAGSCSTGCAGTPLSGERRIRFYTPRESLPTVEDFGEAQLVNGRAYVRIDPAFANTMEPRANYMVFITPEGNSRGLYVTAKTLNGFAVYENESGRSTLAFSYRIVANPFGERPTRLEMFTMAKPRPQSAPKWMIPPIPSFPRTPTR